MKRLVLFLLLSSVAWAGSASSVPPSFRVRASDPATCSTSSGNPIDKLYYNTTRARWRECTATDTWSDLQYNRTHATDCTSLTDGQSGDICWEQDANTIYVCEPSAGACDTAGEWATLATATVAGLSDVTLTSPALGETLCVDSLSPTHFANCQGGTPVSRTVSGATATLDCAQGTGDRSKILALTNAGAITLTGFTPGAACPDGATIFVDVQGSATTATLTPASGNCNGAATCALTQGLWRVRSDGTQTFAVVETRTAASSGLGYQFHFCWGHAGPADSTTYYGASMCAAVGTATIVSSTYTAVADYVHKACTIKSVSYRFRLSAGTNESVQVYIRHNDTTDFGNATFDWSAGAPVRQDITGLSQAIAAGDTLAVKVVTPAWATNPTNITGSAVVYCE